MHSLYTATLLLLLLITALSITLLGITAHLLAWTAQHASQTFIWSDTFNNEYNFHFTPLINRNRSYILLLATGCLCTVFNFSSFLALGTLRPFQLAIRNRNTPYKLTTKPILVACTILSVLFTVIALALSFTDTAQDPALPPCVAQWQDCSDQSALTIAPRYTLEGWVCTIAQQGIYNSSINGFTFAELNGICTETKVVRWWTVALLVAELSVMICGFMILRDHGTHTHGTRFEKDSLAWDNAAAQPSHLAQRDHEHEDAAPRYEDHIPALSGQNGKLFQPLDRITDDYEKRSFAGSSPVSPIRDEKRASPAYEPVGNQRVHEVGGHERHVHEVEAISEYPSELPANHVVVMKELPAEKPVR